MHPSPCARMPIPLWSAAVLAAACLSVTVTARGEDPSAEQVERGRELFARVWKPNDPRSRRGDGLGPVFNAQSCLACHDQGGPGGGGGTERNVEVATAGPAGFGNAFSATFGGPGYQFAYSFGMDFGNGRFEYRLASNVPGASQTFGNTAGRSAEPPLDRAALAAIHPGFLTSRSVLLHRFGTDPDYHAWRAGVAGTHGTIEVRTSLRNPTPLFGLGLVDAIPDSVIESGARRKPGRVPGRVSRLADGRIGRFGWKGQTATLREFVAAAAATEMGLETPDHAQAADPRLPGLGAPGQDLDGSDLNALTAYLTALPSPVEETEAEGHKEGASAFRTVGCAGCHVPKLGDVEGLYSDLLLHDMSPKLGDSGPYGVLLSQAPPANPAPGRGRSAPVPATAREWRTPPLWGLVDSAPYLHDGTAATIDEAIRSHGGQGATAAQRYAQLPSHRREQLLAFLGTLRAPRGQGPRP